MIFTDPINTNGIYPLNNGDPTRQSEGTVVAANPTGGQTMEIGYMDQEGNFRAYIDGNLISDLHVRHGVSALLAVKVGSVGGTDDLRIGYAG